MGSKASKPVQSATRKFPSRAPGAVPPTAARPQQPRASPAQQAAQNAGRPAASFTKDEAIRSDGIDPESTTNPAFNQRLKQMGVASPNPTFSPSSRADPTFPSPAQQRQALGANYPSPSNNVTLSALEARRRLQREAEEEFETMGRGSGKSFLDVGLIRQILVMREKGAAPAEIERRFRLKPGVVARLGTRGMVTPLGGGAISS